MMRIDVCDAVVFDGDDCAATARCSAQTALRGAAEGCGLRAFLAFPISLDGELFANSEDVLTGKDPAVVVVVGGGRVELRAAAGRMVDGAADVYLDD